MVESGSCSRIRGMVSKMKRFTKTSHSRTERFFVMRYDSTDLEQRTDDQWEEGTPGVAAQCGGAQRERRGGAPGNARAE